VGSVTERADRQSLNPGNLKTDLQRNLSPLFRAVIGFMLHPPIYGAYTELFAGLSPAVSFADSSKFIIPWGRVGVLPTELEKGLVEGGTGSAVRFWNYCEAQSKEFV
jgi:retinol dehydrogenase-12